MPTKHRDATTDSRFRWSTKTLTELESMYWDVIAPEMRRDGKAPDRERPSYRWLVDHGFSGLAYALREHHDRTLTEFFHETVGIPEEDDGYDWEIDEETTVEALTEYLHSLDTRNANVSSSTIRSRRSRLATLARRYETIHGDAKFTERTADESTRPAEIDRWLAVFDQLNDDLNSDGSKLRYLSDLTGFFQHRIRRGRARFNPVGEFRDIYQWTEREPDHAALSAQPVKTLYATADSSANELLVLALAGWGLRIGEVAALHASQLSLDESDPSIEFEDRKSGPGSVALIYGIEQLEHRLRSLAAHEDWNGFLFPSTQSNTGHRTASTLRKRFKRLATRGDVTVDGDTPIPHMGRRFWYRAYRDAVAHITAELSVVADEQGATDPSTIIRNYLSNAEIRALQREQMRDRLAAAFEDVETEP